MNHVRKIINSKRYIIEKIIQNKSKPLCSIGDLELINREKVDDNKNFLEDDATNMEGMEVEKEVKEIIKRIIKK